MHETEGEESPEQTPGCRGEGDDQAEAGSSNDRAYKPVPKPQRRLDFG